MASLNQNYGYCSRSLILYFVNHWFSKHHEKFKLKRYPEETGRKLNVHKTFRRRPGRAVPTGQTVQIYLKDVHSKFHLKILKCTKGSS